MKCGVKNIKSELKKKDKGMSSEEIDEALKGLQEIGLISIRGNGKKQKIRKTEFGKLIDRQMAGENTQGEVVHCPFCGQKHFDGEIFNKHIQIHWNAIE